MKTIEVIGGAIALLTAVVGLIMMLCDKKAKRKEQDKKDFHDAANSGDSGGLYAVGIICFLLFVSGCQTTSKTPDVVVIQESENFPVCVMVHGIPFDKLSMTDVIELKDWNDVKIQPVRKGSAALTHYLVTPRAIEKLRPVEK